MGEIIKMIPRDLARRLSTLTIHRYRPGRTLAVVIGLLICVSSGFLGYAQATTTTLSSDVNPSVFGETVTFTAEVTVDSGTQTPSGTVTFYDGVVSLGTSSLSTSDPYEATLATSTLAVGLHDITATYSGDGDTDTSTSDPLYQTVNRADTTVAITEDTSDPSTVGDSYNLTVTLAVDPPGTGTPTGTITVDDGENSVSGTAGASVILSLTSTSAGPKLLTATYSGDENFNTATDTEPHEVSKGDVVISKDPAETPAVPGFDSTSSSYVGEQYTVSGLIVVDTGSGTPGGTVTVDDGEGQSCTSDVSSADGSWSCTLTSLVAGDGKTLTATYSGDSNFNTATATESHDVNKGDVVISTSDTGSPLGFNDTPDPSFVGQQYTVSGYVVKSTGTGTPSGTVTVDDGEGQSCISDVSSTNGSWSCTLTSLTAGDGKTLTAIYSGDSHFNTATETEEHDVDKRATKITITGSDTPLIVNDTGTFTVTVTDTSPGTPSIPTGTVTVTVTTVPSGQGTMSPSSPLTLDAAGQATLTYTPSSALDPTHAFTATYGGDSVHAAALNAELVQNIVKRAVDIQLICSPIDVYIGQPINCQIIISDDTTAGSYVTPDEANLTLFDDRHDISPASRFSAVSWTTNGGSRVGTFTYTPAAWDTDADQALPFVVPAPAQATATITAEYAGSPVHANEQAEQPLTIRLRPTWTSVMCSMPPILVNQTVVDCTVTVEDISGVSQGATPPEGVITLTTDVAGTSGTSNKSGPTGSPDSEWEFDYVCTRLDEKADFDTIQADYAANDGIHADSSGAFAQGIQRRPTVTTLSCSSTATGVECTATTKEDSGNAGVDVLLEGGFVLLPDDDITGCTSLGPATEPTCTDFPVNEDALLVNVSVQFNPTNDVHLPSTASETVDRSDQFDPAPTPGVASTCDAGCGSGGIDIHKMIYDLNAAAVALHAVQMGLETAALVADVIPDLFTGGGVIVVAGVTIPISDIAAAIISGSSIALEIAIVAMTTDLDGDGIPDAVEDTVTNTDSTLTDTDGDAMGDMDEIGYCAGYYGGSLRPDPNNPDSDSDGLMDGYELAPFATDVCVADTDCDTLPDGVEIACRTDPTAVNGFYRGGYTSYNTTYDDTFAALADVIDIGGATVFPFADLRDHPNPREGDTDGDGLADDIEFGQGRLAVDTSTPYAQNATSGYYSPYVNDDDSDDDGLHDGAEDLNGNGQWNGTVVGTGANVTSGETHLCLADTDGDGLTDGEEEALFGRGGIEVHSTLGTITVPALDDDSDDDGLSDYEEQIVTG
ncbi:Ig-like domain repeat protein, partial [Candidatus Bipolaricaulota bacterium]|nr:Ig-like domain repeat protein [Candidatus Bipolaricaulota bacterium]